MSRKKFNHKRKRQQARNLKASNQPPKKKQKTQQKAKPPQKPQEAKWESAQHCISWLLSSKQDDAVSLDTFQREYFGTKPLLIKRNDGKFYSQRHIKLQLGDIHQIIKQNALKFGQHFVCKTYDGAKEEQPSWIQPNEKVCNHHFKKIMHQGYTVQFHHPQHFHGNIARLIGLLESYFGVEVGCNVYITPSKKQGLAPHWDDVEVFVLQIEGKKHWKLYQRTEDENKYPLQSSNDLDLANDCPDAQLLFECDLEPGDLLYFPRGTIHCAQTVGDSHSTHITISTHQRATWGDFIHTLMEKAMDDAIEQHTELRQNMPINFISYMGSTFEENADDDMKQKQQAFTEKLQRIVSDLVVQSVGNVVHSTCDVVAADFVSHRLPPAFMLNQQKKKNVNEEKQEIEFTESTKVCLKCVDWIRVVNDDEFDNEQKSEVEEDDEEEEDGEEDFEEDEDNDLEYGSSEYVYKDKKTGVGIKMIDLPPKGEDKQQGQEDKVATFMDDDEDEEDDETAEEEQGEFRLYTCINNDVNTHCVEFTDDAKGDNGKYVKLPMFLRPVVDRLIHAFPEFITLKELVDRCKEETPVTLPEIEVFLKLLLDMQLISKQ